MNSDVIVPRLSDVLTKCWIWLDGVNATIAPNATGEHKSGASVIGANVDHSISRRNPNSRGFGKRDTRPATQQESSERPRTIHQSLFSESSHHEENHKESCRRMSQIRDLTDRGSKS